MDRLHLVAVVALTALAVARIAVGYAEGSQTIDEAVHVAAGVEWLDQNTYRLDPKNPPLARVAVALLPYWDGARTVTKYDEANEALGSGSRYAARLSLARTGTLPAFVLLVALVYLGAKWLFDPAAALASVFLLTTLPAVLAHAGLATTDIAAAALAMAAILAFARWLKNPSKGRAALLGAAVGVAALVKFTTLLFLAASALGILAARSWLTPPSQRLEATWVRMALQLGIAVGLAAVIVWSGYWWSFGVVDLGVGPIYGALDAVVPEGSFARDIGTGLLGARLPAPEFFFGMLHAGIYGLEGHRAYLLGEVGGSGWWYFFPVAIAVKTPLPFLALALAGVVSLTRSARRQRQWLQLVPVVAPVAILIALAPSSINIGLRHALAAFPFLSICGGVALVRLWSAHRHRALARAVVGALLLWQLGSSLTAHPNYIAYFNPIASGQPEDFLIDSDLDWGQDLYRLRDELDSRGIDDISLALFTTADLENFGLDRFPSLEPDERRRGWIAASITTIRRQPGYAWLEDYDPEALVGRSIRLYYIDPASEMAR